MSNIVFHLHHTGTGASAQPRLMATLFGYSLFRIDTIGSLPIGGDVFKSLDDALEDPRFKGWHWVFFDANASDSLTGLPHQQDKVVYVFGHDVDGWDRSIEALPGALIRIDTASPKGTQHTAPECAIVAIVHRFYGDKV